MRGPPPLACGMWIKKILYVNFFNFEKFDKPEGGGGSDNVDKAILLNFDAFFGQFNTYLVVFSLYLAIIKNFF